MSTAFTHNRAPSSGATRAGGSHWHKAESYCNVFNINFPMAAQA
jgi:hypothetical protein